MLRPGAKPWRRWCAEPIVHFVVMGTLLFLIYQWLSPTPNNDTIVISQDMIEGLRQDHIRRTGAAPLPNEEQALIDMLVSDEVLFREALSMGVDQGDPIVRRRLIQKMGFMIEELNPIPDPTEDELRAFLERRRDRFASKDRVSFTHIFLRFSGSLDELEKQTVPLFDRLSAGADPAQLGDPFILGYNFVRRSQKELAAKFGSTFAATVMTLPEGVWSGPVPSSYGYHLVLITEKTEASLPDLDKLRPQITKLLLAEKREAATRQALLRLRERYQIQIEGQDG